MARVLEFFEKRTLTGTPEGAVAGTAPRTLLVLTQHEEEPMNITLAALDREWLDLNRSAAGREAVASWGEMEPALAGTGSVDGILQKRAEPAHAGAVLAALARLAADHDLAARTLLQALLPGLVRLATTACADDRHAIEELVALAWERIRTYPTHRPGSVAANVLWDVRKRYRAHREIDVSKAMPLAGLVTSGRSAEDVALEGTAIDEIVSAQREGKITDLALRLILRTRVDEVPLERAAAELNTTTSLANCIRWRAERRLRPVLAMAS